MVDVDVLLAKLRRGGLLGVAAAAVLQWREDGRGHVEVVALHIGALLVQPPGEEDARLDGHRRQLRFPRQNVPHGVDVGHVRLLVDHRNVAGLVLDDAGRLQADLVSAGAAADGEEDGVELLRFLLAAGHVGVGHRQFARLRLINTVQADYLLWY